MSKIESIVIHCSDSDFGTAIDIDRWHRAKKWDRIGYMGVILNGWVKPGMYWDQSNGAWEWGRPLDQDNQIETGEVEAHALGWNHKSVGICLIGKKSFTYKQMQTLCWWITDLRKMWDIPVEKILGHYEVDKAGKTCPNINMDLFRHLFVSGEKGENVWKSLNQA